MFATRGNNENAIYDQQTAAAAKPLNQGVKGLAPKTPGNKAPKTPFKVPLNDENAAFTTGGGKRKCGSLFGGEGKDDKVDKSAFVTPAGPRTRAPLGNKTTNAKAITFQASGAQTQEKEKGSIRPTSPRLHRAKVKVQADPLNAEGDGEEREIERMPPREVPLPDHPDDWPVDRQYPQFEGKNFTRGWWSEFQCHKDKNEDDLSDFEEKLKKLEEWEKTKALAERKALAVKNRAQVAAKKAQAEVPKQPSSLSSKWAVSALSTTDSTATRPNFTSATASTKSRAPLSTVVSKKPLRAASARGNARHTAAKAVSNTTLGYSKGRAVSANARKPLSDIHRPPSADECISKASPMKTPFGRGSDLDELLGLTHIEDEDDTDTLVGSASASIEGDDDMDGFQLDTAEI